MIQKALLIGSIAAFSVLLVVNLASHRPEAFFIMGWLASKMNNLEYATRMFETWIESEKIESATKDRLRIAGGSALSNSNFDKEAVGILSQEATSTTWEEKKRLEAYRLLALGNARAKDSQTYEGVQKKMQLYGALVAYSWAYRLSGDADAQANYDIVKKLFEEHVEEEKAETQTVEKEPPKDERTNDEPTDNDEEAWKDEKSKDEEKAQNEEGKTQEPPKTWNWTNGGTPVTLNSDPGGARGSNGSVPLSDIEREELEASIRALSELQGEREKFIRPDGQAQPQGAIPNSLRELFSGDPFFGNLIPQPEEWTNGKSW